MTRINVGIRPAELNDRHLMAEHREIKRVPNLVSRGRYSLDNQPSTFKLGTGHVKFFYDKLLYLKRRYDSLYSECRKRGFNVQNYANAWGDVPKHLMNDYIPTKRDREIIQQRIQQRIQEKSNKTKI